MCRGRTSNSSMALEIVGVLYRRSVSICWTSGGVRAWNNSPGLGYPKNKQRPGAMAGPRLRLPSLTRSGLAEKSVGKSLGWSVR